MAVALGNTLPAGTVVGAEKTLGFGRIGSCILYISAKKPPSEKDWAAYVAWFQKTAPPGSNIVSVVFEESSGPNAAQRRQISEMTAKCTLKVAVIARSTIARGLVTAMSWFKEGYRAFGPEEVDGAMNFLGLEGPAAIQVKSAINRIVEELSR